MVRLGEESELEQIILRFARAGFPLNSRRLRKLAYQYAEENDIKGFSPQTRMAGEKWLKHFMQRHKAVRSKKAQNLSINRAMGANLTMIRNFYQQYEDMMKELNIVSPKQIWNCDETGIQDIPNQVCKVIGETGYKANTIVPSEQGVTSTGLTYVNADGQCVPPLIIHKGGKVPAVWTENAPVGVMVRCSDNGWINADLFLEYALRWLRWMRTNQLLDRPHILLLDSHRAHVYNIRFIRIMQRFKIHVLALPAHTSHLTQPLDGAPYARLKTTWTEELTDFLFMSAGSRLPKSQFFDVFWPAWKRAMTASTIIAGFRKTGIYPLNPKAVDPKSLGPSAASDNIAILQDVEVDRKHLNRNFILETESYFK